MDMEYLAIRLSKADRAAQGGNEVHRSGSAPSHPFQKHVDGLGDEAGIDENQK